MYIREEKALWLVAHTITQDQSEIFFALFFFFFQASALQCALSPWKIVKYEHLI